MTLHEDEFHIDISVVADLIAAQMPEWSELPLRRLDTAGTVNFTYRLGSDMLVRLPRAPAYSRGPLRESRWLPIFEPLLPLQISNHLALGTGTDAYPSPWSVLSWIPGENATPRTLSDLTDAATRLGEFVVALRGVGTAGGPGNHRRGHGLERKHADALRYILQLPDDIDRSAVRELWEACLLAPTWDGPPLWFHGDLHSGNLLALDGELTAVIDFEDCGVGDPASDLIAAWWLFDESSRDTFLGIIDPDDASLRRGMGWALYMCIAGIPYYQHSNPEFAGMARTALNQILGTR